MADLSSIISTVEKLLRLAASSNHPGEVEAAQAQAQRIITKYQIEEAQLNGHIGQGNVTSKQVPTPKTYPASKAMLLSYIAKHNFCKVLRTDDYAVIYGYASDIEICIAMYEVLLIHMVSEMKIKLEIARDSNDSTFHARTWTKSFFGGYCVGIGERMKQIKSQVIQEADSAGTSVELVLRDKQHEVENFFQSIDHEPARNYEMSSKLGYDAGMDSSKKADINQTKIED
jgi:hypothetical protein